MIVDNFDLIESLLKFPDEDTFYHLQVIRRGKDHKDMTAANRTIQSYFIDRNGKLEKIKDEIKTLCELFGARAYINLNPKSYKKCTLQCISDMAKRASDGDFKKMYKQWNSVVGYTKPLNRDDSRWIVDIDYDNILNENATKVVEDALLDIWWEMIQKNETFRQKLMGNITVICDIKDESKKDEIIEKYKKETLKKYFIIAKIPTKNGYHLITRPFDVAKFQDKFLNYIDLHKNNPTILYVPEI